MLVSQQSSPFVKAQLGRDDSAAFSVSLFDEIEEEACELGVEWSISHFVNDKTIKATEVFDKAPVGSIRLGLVKLRGEVLEVNETASSLVVDGVDEEGSCKSAFPAAGGPDEEQDFGLGDE